MIIARTNCTQRNIHLRLSVFSFVVCLVDRGDLEDERRPSVPKPSTSQPYTEENLIFNDIIGTYYFVNAQLKDGLITEFKHYRHTNLAFARNTRYFGDFKILGFTTEIN